MTDKNKQTNKSWNGIPRNKIKWHPTIDEEKCTHCLQCVAFCKQGVYGVKEGKPQIVNPNNCVVGCTGCDGICPVKAISHPPKEYLEKLTGKTAPIAGCCAGGGCCPSKEK